MNILNEREKTHGHYGLVASVSQALKDALRIGPLDELPPVHRESLDLICTKVARVICGDHNERDHWIDIKGYAELVLQNIEVPPGISSIQEPEDEPTDASIGDDWDYDPNYRPRSGLPR